MRWRATGAAWQETDTRDIGVGGAFLLRVAEPVGTGLELVVAALDVIDGKLVQRLLGELL